MTLLTNFKKLGVNTAVLATSISLVACGGGGSEGYYDKGSSGSSGNGNSGGNDSTTDTSQTAVSLNSKLQNLDGQNLQQASDNSKVRFAVQVLNADNGGISGKNVRLSIAGNALGVTSTNSLVATGENGIAVFEVNIPELATGEGSVQLTATVEGTTISLPYTLNIKKTSTIQSDYRLLVDPAVINLPKGSVDVIAKVTDNKGGIKSGQSVTLTLPAEMQDKFSITTGSNVSTDSLGNAKFTIQASSSLTAKEIEEFVGKTLTLNFLLVDEHKAEKTAPASITFKDVSQVVDTLTIVKPDAAMAAQGGTAKVIVVARNTNGGVIANKKVNLALTGNTASYGVKLDKAEAVTNAKGEAEFTVSSEATHPIALSQEGILLKASYADTAEVFSVAKIDVVTNNSGSSDLEAIQRLEIGSSYKMNAKNDSIEVRVKAVDNQGFAAKKGKIKMALNPEAASNGVTFEGAAEKDLVDGYAYFTINTNAQTPEAVVALVKAGIKASFTADNGISNSINITVADEEVSEEPTRYLSIAPILTAYDYTKNHTIEVKVKAIGVNGSAVEGETVSLAIGGALTDKQLQDLGLSHTGQASKQTDESGYATFTLKYDANLTDAQKALAEQGVQLVAVSSNKKTQSLRLNFKPPVEQGVIDLDHFEVNMLGDLILSVGQEHTFAVTVDAKGNDGKALKNQLVTIGLNEAALNNGVSYASPQALRTDENGKVKFDIKVKANNAGELTNLIANGLTVAVKSVRADGTAFTVTKKVEVYQPAVVIPDLAGLEVSYIDAQTVSVLGGEVRVKVTAKDKNNNIIPNTPINIALSSLAGPRVSLSSNAAVTNSKGEAEFTVRVAEGGYDANLIKNGVVFAVVGSNLNNGDRLQQTGAIQVVAPQDSINLRLSSDQKAIEFGQTVKVQVAVKDELGVNSAYPVRLALSEAAAKLGVKLESDSVVTSANGFVNINLTVPNTLSETDKASLVNDGISVVGSIYNPKGEEIKSTLKFDVKAAINPYHIAIENSKNSLNVNGDTTFVTVKLLDVNQGSIASQPVTLSIADPRNAASINGQSQIMTNALGEAVFEVKMKRTDAASMDDIVLTAVHTATNGAVVRQQSRLTIHTPTTLAPQLDLKLKASKDKVNVRGDAVDVSVLVTDMNGSSQPRKAVTLTIPDYQDNGAYIKGASTLETDENGWATFTVVVDESLRDRAYDFIGRDLNVIAVVQDSNGTQRRQNLIIDVVASEVPVAIGSIDVNVNPIELKSSENGVYYIKEGSVQLLDVDGKPIANQDVVLDTRPVTYRIGSWLFEIAKNPWEITGSDANGNPIFKLKDEYPFTASKGWVSPGGMYYPLVGGVPDKQVDENTVQACNVNPSTTSWVANGQPLRVVRFIGSDNANPSTATYRTDRYGRFDFQIEYPKNKAHWVTVEIGAKATLAASPVRGTTRYTLSAQDKDYAADGSTAPNRVSPYTTCIN